MSAQKYDPRSIKNAECNIAELLQKKEWQHVLIRIKSMKFYLPITERRLILESSDAPAWLKNTAFVSKIVRSC